MSSCCGELPRKLSTAAWTIRHSSAADREAFARRRCSSAASPNSFPPASKASVIPSVKMATRSPRLERHGRLAVGRFGKSTERQPCRAEPLGLPRGQAPPNASEGASQDQRRAMTRARVPEGSAAFVVHGPEQRREPGRLGQVIQLAVDLGRHGPDGLPAHRHEAAQRRLKARHDERRGDPLARDVSDGDPDAPVAERQEIEVVAGDTEHRTAEPVAVQAGGVRIGSRQKPQLHGLGDLDFPLEPPLLRRALPFQRRLPSRDHENEQDEEAQANGHVPDRDTNGSVGVFRQDVLESPASRREHRGRQSGAAADVPDEQQNRADVKDQEREVGPGQVIEHAENKDQEQTARGQDAGRLPAEPIREPRGPPRDRRGSHCLRRGLPAGCH